VQAGAKFPTLDGDVELSNVTFAYPSRPGRLIFKHFNIAIPAGEDVEELQARMRALLFNLQVNSPIVLQGLRVHWLVKVATGKVQ
jgi:hypothetical protein